MDIIELRKMHLHILEEYALEPPLEYKSYISDSFTNVKKEEKKQGILIHVVQAAPDADPHTILIELVSDGSR